MLSERLIWLAILAAPGPAIARNLLLHTTSGAAKRNTLKREGLRHFLPWYDSPYTESWPYPSGPVRFRQLVFRRSWRESGRPRRHSNSKLMCGAAVPNCPVMVCKES